MVWGFLSDIAFITESNLEKNIQSLTQKYRAPSKLQNETKKDYWCPKVSKMCLFGKIDKNVQFNYLFSEIPKSFNLRPRKAGGFFYLRTEKSCPSEAVFSLQFPF